MSVTLKLSDRDAKIAAEGLFSLTRLFIPVEALDVDKIIKSLSRRGFSKSDFARLSAAFETAWEANQR